jgi:flap endonuclease-1
MPTDIHGNKTGHLVGLMARVTFYQENGIRTVWVFDGKPPAEKYNELSRRSKLKKEAE